MCHNTHRGTARPPRPPLIVSSSIEKRGDPSRRSFSGCGRGAPLPPAPSLPSLPSLSLLRALDHTCGSAVVTRSHIRSRLASASSHSTAPSYRRKQEKQERNRFVTLWPEMTSPAISPPTIAADDEPSPRANGMRLTTVYCARAGGRAGGRRRGRRRWHWAVVAVTTLGAHRRCRVRHRPPRASSAAPLDASRRDAHMPRAPRSPEAKAL